MLSFVLPAHDEIGSLSRLLEEIRDAAQEIAGPWEVVVVDDGSTDGSADWLAREADRNEALVVVTLDRNRGQSAAMSAGFEAARGEIIVTLDADLQNDPRDAAVLIDALRDSDLACGVRVDRHDRWTKRIGSRIGNGMRRFVLRDRFRDVGCTLKAWRRETALAIPKFDGFHRFIPILAEREGFRVVERPVAHRARRHGRTHYGNLGRALRGGLDLLGVAWLLQRRRSFRRARRVEQARDPAAAP